MQVIPRWVGRAGVLAVAATLAAGCGAASSSGGSTGAKVLSAENVVKLAASQASQVSTMSAQISVQMTGQQPMRMQGTMTMSTQPSLTMDMNLSNATMNGKSMGSMRELLLSRGIYIKTPTMSQISGKPWTEIPTAALNKASGNEFGQLTQRLQQQDPLSSAQMLNAAQDVKQVGTGTVNGVPVTRYSGVIPVQAAISKLTPKLQSMARKQFSTLGISTLSFTAGVDGQHQIRQLDDQAKGTAAQMVTSFTVTGLNQPVSITAPPASQVNVLSASSLNAG